MITAQILGRLGADPDTRQFQGGQVTTLSIASNRKTKDKDETSWLRVKCFGKTGELAQRFLKKGSRVYVTGRLVEEQWEDKGTGQKRSMHVLIADAFEFADSPADAQGGGSRRPDPRAGSSYRDDRDETRGHGGPSPSYDSPDDGDIPF